MNIRRTKTNRTKTVLEVRSFFHSFFHSQSTGGMVLLVCAAVALIIANTPSLQHYQAIWNTPIGITFGSFSLEMSLLHWINDGLMVIFFFVVGLEIKRELLVGELASRKKAALPIFAAIGGMLVPALIFLAFNYGSETQHGWGIPMATDIAFAVGIISILGKRCPLALKIFLTALAIVDDLGAILVIAIFYPTHEIELTYLLYAGLVTVFLIIMNRAKVRSVFAYLLPGVVLWYFVYQSGIHATIAGVILAMTIPSTTAINELRFYVRFKYLLEKFKLASNNQLKVLANPDQQYLIHRMNVKLNKINPMMHRFEAVLHPWVAFVVMPLFALANSGVVLDGELFSDGPIPMLAVGIFFGLIVGKPLGILLFSWIAVKLKIAILPVGTKWMQIVALGVVAGVGFTMSIFIDNLAFKDENLINIGKVAILATSFFAAVLGLILLHMTSPPTGEIKHRKRKENIITN